LGSILTNVEIGIIIDYGLMSQPASPSSMSLMYIHSFQSFADKQKKKKRENFVP
jgi:hypothetical protein